MATGVATISGFCLLSLLRWPGMITRVVYEQAALSYLVGLAVIGFETLVLGYLGIAASLSTLLLLQIVPLVIFLVVFKRRAGRILFKTNMNLESLWSHRPWQWLLIALIASKLVYIATINLASLHRSDDAFQWAIGLAKATYYAQSHAGYAMHFDYPKLPGLQLHWFGVWFRDWNEFGINLSHFNYFLALLLLFYANLRASVGKSASILGVYLLSTLPVLVAHSVIVGHVDLLMGIYLSFAGIYAYRYACDGEADNLLIAAIFTLIMPAIKLEGLIPYFFIGCFAIITAWVYRTKRLRPLAIWSITGVLAAVAISLIALLAVVYGDTAPGFLEPVVWDRIKPGNHFAETAGALVAHFGYEYNNWILVGTLAAIAMPILSIRFWDRAELVLGLYGLMLLGSFLYLSCISGAYVYFANGATLNRTFLQMIPVILFAVVVMMARRYAERCDQE